MLIYNNMNKKDRIFKQKQFLKVHGTGNNFIIIQHNNQTDQQLQKLSIRLCNPNFGIGADGILAIFHNLPHAPQNNRNSCQQPPRPRYKMRIFNRDGSKAQMCGNGLRCFCACLRHLGMEDQDKFNVGTDAGDKKISLYKSQEIYRVKIQIGSYLCMKQIQNMEEHLSGIIPGLQFVNAHFLVFNIPHYVILLKQMPSSQKIIQYGKQLQKHINSNINFVTLEQSHIYVRTFQRGAGLTLACGTGACASYLVCVHNKQFGEKDRINVRTEGGYLIISNDNGNVIMDGPAQIICRGVYY